MFPALILAVFLSSIAFALPEPTATVQGFPSLTGLLNGSGGGLNLATIIPPPEGFPKTSTSIAPTTTVTLAGPAPTAAAAMAQATGRTAATAGMVALVAFLLGID